MSPRSLSRWDLWAKTFLHKIPRKKNFASHFSTVQVQLNTKSLKKHNSYFQHRNSSSIIVDSPFPRIDIPKVLIPEVIWETVDRFPDAAALKCGITGRVYSYGDMQKLSRRFMNSLIKAGFSHGDTVAVVLPNCPEFAIITLGALEADLTVSFLNFVYTADEICHQLKDSGSVCVISGTDELPTVLSAITKLEESTKSKTVRMVIAVDIPSPTNLPGGVARFSEMIADSVDHSKYQSYQKGVNDIAFLPYSSGTTGLAKGVCLSHSNIVSNVFQFSANTMEINSPDKGQDTLLGLLPFYHIFGLTVILINALQKGARIITLPKFEQQTFIRVFENDKVSVLFLVPPLVLYMGNSPDITKKHLSNVKFILSGAAPIGDTDMEKLKAKIPADCVLCQGYGMSELSPCVLVAAPPIKNLATCGAPVPNCQGKIVCPDTGKDLGPNQTGELCFRGPQVMLGYHNNPKATAEMIDAEGWLHTGDIGYYDEDSHFYIQDRLKELIKVKGFQVPPAELEAILRTHPEVADVGVIGVPDARAGEVPVAYIVKAKGKSLSEDQVKDFLSSKVAKHKQVSRVIFVDSIPKSAAGKILRKELRLMYKESQK